MKEETLEHGSGAFLSRPLPVRHALRQVGGQCRLCAVTLVRWLKRRAMAQPSSSLGLSWCLSLRAQPLLSAVSILQWALLPGQGLPITKVSSFLFSFHLPHSSPGAAAKPLELLKENLESRVGQKGPQALQPQGTSQEHQTLLPG